MIWVSGREDGENTTVSDVSSDSGISSACAVVAMLLSLRPAMSAGVPLAGNSAFWKQRVSGNGNISANATIASRCFLRNVLLKNEKIMILPGQWIRAVFIL